MRNKLIALLKKINLFGPIKSILDRRYAYHVLQGYFTDPIRRKRISKFEASLYRKFNLELPTISPKNLDIVQSLETTGFVMNVLNVDEFASSLYDYISTLKCHDPSKKSFGYFDNESPPPGTRLGFVKCEDLIYAPGLFDLLADDALVGSASIFFGAQCRVDYIGAWWSYPQGVDADSAPDVTQLFHRDIDTLNSLKFFIYLTDVDADHGPHWVIPFSQKLKFETSKDQKHSDEQVLYFCKKNNLNVLPVVGPRGSNFFEDVFNLHRGTLPKKGRRLIFEVIYSLTQTPFGPKKPFGDLSKIRALNKREPEKKYFSNIICYK